MRIDADGSPESLLEDAVPGSAGDEASEDPTTWGLTRDDVRQMLDRIYYIYKEGWWDSRADMDKEPSEALGMLADSDSEVHVRYLKNLPEDVTGEDVIQAYRDGKLPTFRPPPPRPEPIPIEPPSEEAEDSPTEFWHPKRPPVLENARETLALAMSRVTKTNAVQVMAARKQIFLAYQKSPEAAAELGLSHTELKAKLRQWGGTPAKGAELETSLNRGLPDEFTWGGIQNSSFLGNSGVTAADVSKAVREIEGTPGWMGPSGDSLRTYIARAMSAIDTRISYKDLAFLITSTLKPNGQFNPKDNRILIRSNSPNTVAHELGHYLDYKWAREVYPRTAVPASELLDSLNVEYVGVTPLRLKWLQKFRAFIMDISARANITSSYMQERKEVFARFVSEFVDWVNRASGRPTWKGENYYSDKFRDQDFRYFVRLLQEKSYVDRVEPPKPGATTASLHVGSTPSIVNDVYDSHGGEVFGTLSAVDESGKTVGALDYSLYEGKGYIQMLTVLPERRREGIATALKSALAELAPEGVETFGDYVTEAGAAFEGLTAAWGKSSRTKLVADKLPEEEDDEPFLPFPPEEFIPGFHQDVLVFPDGTFLPAFPDRHLDAYGLYQRDILAQNGFPVFLRDILLITRRGGEKLHIQSKRTDLSPGQVKFLRRYLSQADKKRRIIYQDPSGAHKFKYDNQFLDYLVSNKVRTAAWRRASIDYPGGSPITALASYGAAIRMANPGMDSAKFRAAMFAQYGKPISILVDALVAKKPGVSREEAQDKILSKLEASSQGVIDKLLKKYGELRIPDALASAVEHYHKGELGAGWYQGVYSAVQSVFGEDAGLFLDFIAATSPSTNPSSNLRAAMKAYWQYKNGLPFSGFMNARSVVPNLKRAVRGETLQEEKVYNFAKALRGESDPESKKHVVVDRWMARVFLQKDIAKITRPEYLFIEELIRAVARQLHKDPDDLTEGDLIDYANTQARIWVGIRGEGKPDTFPEFMEKRLLEQQEEHPEFWGPYVERWRGKTASRRRADRPHEVGLFDQDDPSGKVKDHLTAKVSELSKELPKFRKELDKLAGAKPVSEHSQVIRTTWGDVRTDEYNRRRRESKRRLLEFKLKNGEAWLAKLKADLESGAFRDEGYRVPYGDLLLTTPQ